MTISLSYDENSYLLAELADGGDSGELSHFTVDLKIDDVN
jgi:hypothetical protein